MLLPLILCHLKLLHLPSGNALRTNFATNSKSDYLKQLQLKAQFLQNYSKS